MCECAVCLLVRYLQYVSVEEMVYLRDGSGTVISLPPLTNSENTKVYICTSGHRMLISWCSVVGL